MDPKTGIIYEFDSQQELEAMQTVRNLIELKGLPKKSCPKCYGRGYTGYDTVKGVYLVCNCVKKTRPLKPAEAVDMVDEMSQRET